MLKTDKIRKPQPVLFYIADYLWSGFAGLASAMMLCALWAWGSSVYGEFVLPSPLTVFRQSWMLLQNIGASEIPVTLYRAAAGIGISLAIGISAGLLAGRSPTAMALLKPPITILLAMPPIVWVVMALFWFAERVVYRCYPCFPAHLRRRGIGYGRRQQGRHGTV